MEYQFTYRCKGSTELETMNVEDNNGEAAIAKFEQNYPDYRWVLAQQLITQ